MTEILEKFYDLSHYKRKIERQDALFIYIALTAMLILVTAYMLFVPDAGTTNNVTLLTAALSGDVLSIFSILFFYTFFTVTYLATRRGNLIVGGAGIPIMYYMIAIVPVFFGSRNMLNPINSLSLSIVIILSGLVLRERGLVGGIAVALVTLITNFNTEFVEQLPLVVIQLVGIGVFTLLYIRYANFSRIEGAETATEQRLKMAEITTQISSLTLGRIGMKDVLKQGIDRIQAGYPEFYHAQVFLLDETGRNAQLVSSTGEAGRALIQRQHSIGVGSQSVIGQATLRNVHVVTSANDPNTVHKHNELLPDTVVEAAFPLRVGEQVIGALDLQSKQDLYLEEDELLTYQSIANSFALAIDNVRQFESAESRVKENQRLAQQASRALEEVDRLNKRLMEQAWSEYMLSQSEQAGVSMDFETDTIEEIADWSESLNQAIEDGNVVQTVNQQRQQLIAIPLKVRGQVIGAMEFELDEDSNIDPTDLSLITEVSERFGLAAENTRLVEESQRVAQREALINEIGSRLQTTNNIESTLTEAVRSLSNVLNANRVSIKLRETESNPTSNGVS